MNKNTKKMKLNEINAIRIMIIETALISFLFPDLLVLTKTNEGSGNENVFAIVRLNPSPYLIFLPASVDL